MKNTVKEPKYGPMGKSMLVSIKMVKSKVKEFNLGKMVQNMKVISKMAKNMVVVRKQSLTRICT